MLYKLILAIIFLVTPQIVMALDTTQYRVASYISMIDSLNWSYNEKASHLAWAVQAYNISNNTLAEASGYSVDIVNNYIKYGAAIKPIRFITDKEDKQLVTKINILNTYDTDKLTITGRWLNRVEKVYIDNKEQIILNRHSTDSINVAVNATKCGKIYVKFFDSTLLQHIGFYGISRLCKSIVSNPKLQQTFDSPLLEGKSLGITFSTSITANTTLQVFSGGYLTFSYITNTNYVRIPGEFVTPGISIVITTNADWEKGIPYSLNLVPTIVKHSHNIELYIARVKTSESIVANIPTIPKIREAIIKAFPIYDNINIVEVTAPIVVPYNMQYTDDWSRTLTQLLIDRRSILGKDGNYNSILYAFVPYRGASVAGMAYINSVVALGIDSTSSWERVFIHELGHALNLKHAPCGNTSNSDNLFPYINGSMGPSLPFNVISGTSNIDKEYDVMGYCGGKWFSDYNYYKLVENVRSRFSPNKSAKTAVTPIGGVVLHLKDHTATFLAKAEVLSGGEPVTVMFNNLSLNGIIYHIDHSDESLLWLPYMPTGQILIEDYVYEVQADTPEIIPTNIRR